MAASNNKGLLSPKGVQAYKKSLAQVDLILIKQDGSPNHFFQVAFSSAMTHNPATTNKVINQAQVMLLSALQRKIAQDRLVPANDVVVHRLLSHPGLPALLGFGPGIDYNLLAPPPLPLPRPPPSRPQRGLRRQESEERPRSSFRPPGPTWRERPLPLRTSRGWTPRRRPPRSKPMQQQSPSGPWSSRTLPS